MADFTREISELTTHQGHIATLATEVGETSTSLGSTGVGPTEMYGILVGQIAHPILSHIADSKSSAITSLSDVLDSTAASLTTAIGIYQATEADATVAGEAVRAEIESIDVPTI